MRVRTQCRECGLPFPAILTPETSEVACPNCGKARSVSSAGWTDGPDGRVEVCPLCGCRHLYRQRDFNRALGCGLVVLGAVLVPWTLGLSLAVCALIDLWLYRRLKDVVVCYQCDTVYRDARPGPRQGEVELLKHDVLKYGKTWEPTQGPSAKDPHHPDGPEGA
jgi:DNA-directed RNA polymerase subunit RPC12/RpoP